jgi:hypothetical protein
MDTSNRRDLSVGSQASAKHSRSQVLASGNRHGGNLSTDLQHIAASPGLQILRLDCSKHWTNQTGSRYTCSGYST